MKIARAYLSAAVLMLIPTVAVAEGYTVVGAGVQSCGKWTTDKPNSYARNVDIEWVVGFISGFNFVHGGDVSENVDAPAIVVWMDNYCSAHPLDPINLGASSLIYELQRRHQKAR